MHRTMRILFGLSCLSMGCSTPSEIKESSTESLKKEISELQKKVAEQNQMIQQLQNQKTGGDVLPVDIAPESAGADSEKKAALPSQPGAAVNEQNQATTLQIPALSEESEMDQWPSEKLFQTAYHLKETHPTQATMMLARLIKKRPADPLADNALYWLGMIQLASGVPHKAILFWDKILRDYPRSNKVPDALYQMALGYKKLNQPDKAQLALERLKKDHGRSRAAALAAQAEVAP